MTIARCAVVAEARRWIGTPYRHQASVLGAGCDCIGLVRGVWRALYGDEPLVPPAYTPDWAEAGEESLLDAARCFLLTGSVARAGAGDVLLFRMRAGAPMKHAAICADDDRIIHAYWGHAVVESRLTPFWRTRLAAAFSFPGVEPWLR